MGPIGDIPWWPLALMATFVVLLVFSGGFFCGRVSKDWGTPHIEWRK